MPVSFPSIFSITVLLAGRNRNIQYALITRISFAYRLITNLICATYYQKALATQ